MLILIIITVLLYKYIILLVVHLYLRTIINENENDKASDKIINKRQLDGDNVINIKPHL
jgi:hypothetical protein